MAIKAWSSVLGGFHRPRFLRHALRDVEKGTLPLGLEEELLKVATAEVIGAQLASGMRYVTDGMLDWHDIFRPFVEAWRNVYPDGLLRYFDNNFFYRIPIFRGEPEPSKPILAPRVRAFKELIEPAEMKVVIPGPLTFTLLSKNESELPKEELAKSIAKALNMELKEAVEAGAKAVQVDEPILIDPYLSLDDINIIDDLFKVLFEGVDAFKILAFYFGVPKKDIYERILNLNVDALVLPLAENPKGFLNLVKEHGCGDKIPVLGIVNARNIYDDDYQHVKDLVKESLNTLKTEEVGFTTSSWLDLIPYRYSLRKTTILGKYSEILSKELGFDYINPLKII